MNIKQSMIKYSSIYVVLLISTLYTTVAQKTINIQRIDTKISIDGILDEQVWQKADIATGFIVLRPTVGSIPETDAEVKLLYDNNSIYVAAFIQETSRAGIMTELSPRDDIGNTDWFGVLIDTYGNGTDGIEFIVQATGVQFDAKLRDSGNDDESWDSVWESAVRLTDNGWFVEMEIPYSAIRFPNQEIQNWKINFIKKHARSGEKSLWNPIDPEQDGFIRQFGDLEGLSGIKSPLRLSFSPYFSGYYNNSKDNGKSINSYSYNGGMDLKYGINDAFTLDMTLIPDFGQVKSDNLVLDLSPFEVKYDENRQFFTEGIELFDKGNLFYSRRIGARPIGSEDFVTYKEDIIIDNPTKTKLYNASKISGRTSSGLGIGVFNAISGRSYATVKNGLTGKIKEIETAPLTNYNLVVIDQNLKNNSSISISNSSVIREGTTYHDAVVTATEFNLKNSKQSIALSGGGAISQLYYDQNDNQYGYRYDLELKKISGKLTYGIEYKEVSDSYNPNDLGFLWRGNERLLGVIANYQLLNKNKYFNRGGFWVEATHSRLHTPNVFTNNNFNGGLWLETPAQWKIRAWSNISPPGYNYYETRNIGRYYKSPSRENIGISIGSDRRKRFRMHIFSWFENVNNTDEYTYSLRLNPRYRINDKISFRLISSFNQVENGIGYVYDLIRIDQDPQIIFGKRDRTTLTNIAAISYNINNKMGLDFRARHYWTKISYDQLYNLQNDGSLEQSYYQSFNDFSYNVFSVDLIYKWRFAPGSDIILAWKNNIEGSISDKNIDFKLLDYFDGIDHLNNFAKNNSLSLKLIYYIDYNSIFNK